VFRSAPRPSYDSLLNEQVEEAKDRQGRGDLAALLRSGDTWQIS
jgi:2-oxoglutarate ferredoxin oxidoreductase subunit beta